MCDKLERFAFLPFFDVTNANSGVSHSVVTPTFGSLWGLWNFCVSDKRSSLLHNGVDYTKKLYKIVPLLAYSGFQIFFCKKKLLQGGENY